MQTVRRTAVAASPETFLPETFSPETFSPETFAPSYVPAERGCRVRVGAAASMGAAIATGLLSSALRRLAADRRGGIVRAAGALCPG